ncbi:hypothetical protein [Paenibacillus sp. 453mf]|uniref:hypothetical protein n=1 Tax=Paenibacillus sp. 453mf TaxID=1761874 RepID=UPI0008E320CE|nr:hypothetical protein [Paenibacillus sp. 453mf]SFS72590.1 hypothetical protein SAMN04488601_102246 [Paenibacillus sp. 453mf]
MGVLKDDSVIELEVFFENTLFKVRTNGADLLVVLRFNDEISEFEEVNSGYLHTYLNDCDIYSQKQIYEMAQNPNTLRNRIDEENYDIKLLKDSLLELGNKYKEITRRIKTLNQQLRFKESVLLQRDELKRKLEKLTNGSYKTIIDTYNSVYIERKQFLGIATLFNDKLDSLTDIKEELSIAYPEEVSGKSAEVISIISNKIKDYNQMVEMIINDFSRFVNDLSKSYSQEVQATTWYSEYILLKESYENLRAELNEEEIIELENLSVLNEQLETIEEKLKNFQLLENEKEQLYEEQSRVLEDYKRNINQVTQKRREFLQSVILSSDNIKINVKPQRDIRDFLNKFRDIIQKKSGYDEAIKKIEENLSNNNWGLQYLKDLIIRIKNEEETTTFDGRFRRMLVALNDEQIDEIILLYPEDEIEVRFKSSENGQFKSLSTASAGQKTSAILTFLLSYGTSPLILDQPEDDLDNQLIHDLIVDRLLKCKQSRQVIVITHNANIPVNGDAEWVVSLDSDTREMSIFKSGSVDDLNIRKKICDVMEGGEKAFTLRALRYGFNK